MGYFVRTEQKKGESVETHLSLTTDTEFFQKKVIVAVKHLALLQKQDSN